MSLSVSWSAVLLDAGVFWSLDMLSLLEKWAAMIARFHPGGALHSYAHTRLKNL
jgi:hypothetical protein